MVPLRDVHRSCSEFDWGDLLAQVAVRYELGVQINLAPSPWYHRSKIITITPRFVLMNKSGIDIQYRQVDTASIRVSCLRTATWERLFLNSGCLAARHEGMKIVLWCELRSVKLSSKRVLRAKLYVFE